MTRGNDLRAAHRSAGRSKQTWSRALGRELHVPEQHPQQPAGGQAVDAGRLGPRLEQVRGAPELPAPGAPVRADPAPPARVVGRPVAEPHRQGRQEAAGLRRLVVGHGGGGRGAARVALSVEGRSCQEVPSSPAVQELSNGAGWRWVRRAPHGMLFRGNCGDTQFELAAYSKGADVVVVGQNGQGF